MSEDINSLFWSKEVFNGAKIREYAKKEGVNPRDFEIQIWVYDTLKVLKEFSDLDLFADKIIAYRNRREFKDLYDLGMMTKIIADSIGVRLSTVQHI